MCKLAIDLCCGAGGTSMGLWMAGFEVIGIDIDPQPNYPFQFIQADATQIDPSWLAEVADVLSIAPPCQAYSVTKYRHEHIQHPMLIEPLRALALQSGLPYILENVEGARTHMIDPVMLCGSAMCLRVRRHRLIESNVDLSGTVCDHDWQDLLPCYKVYVGSGRGNGHGYKLTGTMPVFGGGQLVDSSDLEQGSIAIGINWMTKEELNEAIPPAYGFHVGKQLMKHVLNRSAATYNDNAMTG